MAIDLTNGATDGVVRDGDTVRRPRTPSSEAVEALLAHLEEVGFEYSPRFLGLDGEDRQVLSYISGEAGTYPADPAIWSDSTLEGIGEILRSFHDHTLNFDWSSYAVWPQPCPPDIEADVICHNDLATYNCIFSDGIPIGIIDLDECGPGSRAWDLAYTAFRCIPIGPPKQQRAFGVPAPVQLEQRLELLLAAYGFENTESILSLIPLRIEQIRDRAAELARGSDRNARRIRNERHVESYNEALQFFRSQFGHGRT